MTLLFIHALTVVDTTGRRLLDRVSLHVDAGSVLGIAGGAGAGKSLLCDILVGVRPDAIEIAAGKILLGSRDLLSDGAETGRAVAYCDGGNPPETAQIAIYDRASTFAVAGETAKNGFIVIERDPALLGDICDEIAVLCAGRLVERAPSSDLIHAPRHPYTKALLDRQSAGDQLHIADNGCPFRAQCKESSTACDLAGTDLQMITPDHATACARWRDIYLSRVPPSASDP